MNVLLLGSGGREHALAWIIKKSKLCEKLFIAPGNAGTAGEGKNLDLKLTDFEAVRQVMLAKSIDLVIVGPEEPLVNGISDFIKADKDLKHIPVLGPSSAGAQLEGSKDFAKQFMSKYGIPTANYAVFNASDHQSAEKHILNSRPPVVIKADGLAAGKGVVICGSNDEALETLKEFFEVRKFGKAGEKVVIEEFMDGIELSIFALFDGQNYVLLPSAKDYKKIGEGDTGLNTGGMGSISPVPFVSQPVLEKIKKEIIEPTFEGIKKEGLDYKGFLYFGLMKVGEELKVVEYNVRLGDPETQAVLPRIENDFLDLMYKCASGKLDDSQISISEKVAATVILASGGYPQKYEKGKVIRGLDKVENSIVFHAGTRKEGGSFVTSGGRVLAVTSMSNNLQNALHQCYNDVEKISFEKMYYRKDIGKDVAR